MNSKNSTPLPPLNDPLNRIQTSARLSDKEGPVKRVIRPSAMLTVSPDLSAQSVSQILFGERVFVLDKKERFYFVRTEYDGYKGWVERLALSDVTSAPTHRVINTVTRLFLQPKIKAPALNILPTGSQLSITGEETGQFIKCESGWVVKKHIAPLGDVRRNYMDFALKWVGLPYLWGGRASSGVDCSGFIQVVLQTAGLRTLRDSDHQFESVGRPLQPSEKPSAGDLVFFTGHVGFMVDSEHVLHANATHMAVSIDPLSDVIKWVEQDLPADSNEPALKGFRRIQID